MPASVQGVEIGCAIDAQDDGLAVEHKLLDAVLQGGLGNPRIALRPVLTAARDQAHPIAITLDANAEAVMLDFMKPLWTGRNLGRIRRQAEFERFEHAPKIGIRPSLRISCGAGSGRDYSVFVTVNPVKKTYPAARAVGGAWGALCQNAAKKRSP